MSRSAATPQDGSAATPRRRRPSAGGSRRGRGGEPGGGRRGRAGIDLSRTLALLGGTPRPARSRRAGARDPARGPCTALVVAPPGRAARAGRRSAARASRAHRLSRQCRPAGPARRSDPGRARRSARDDPGIRAFGSVGPRTRHRHADPRPDRRTGGRPWRERRAGRSRSALLVAILAGTVVLVVQTPLPAAVLARAAAWVRPTWSKLGRSGESVPCRDGTVAADDGRSPAPAG